MILGLSFSHNATACMVEPETGQTAFCCSEERFSRRKNEWGMPWRTLEYAFQHVVPPKEIVLVAVGESCRQAYGCEAYAQLVNLEDYATKDAFVGSKWPLMWIACKEGIFRRLFRPCDVQALVRKRLREMGVNAPVEFVAHHTAHAASAYYPSPFDEALVVTLDGEGDGLSGSCWRGQGGRLELLDTLPDTSSLGLFYRSITALLGFKINQQEGKVMGLAGYGDRTGFTTNCVTFCTWRPKPARQESTLRRRNAT